MHSISYYSVQAVVRGYADEMPRPRRVLDVGSLDINGSYRPLFEEEDDYIGCDLTPGKNVDVVVESPYSLPFSDGAFDLVVSGQTLEHSPQPWRLVREMGRVVRPGGCVITVNPSSGPSHMEPDCYRFLPAGMAGLAEWAGLEILMSSIVDFPPWNDCFAVMMRPIGEGAHG